MHKVEGQEQTQEKKKIPRAKTTRNVFDKKEGVKLKVTNPALQKVIGDAEMNGAWLIYGVEKHGKTQLALRIARDLAFNERVDYISAEEGMESAFKMSMRRAGITTADKIFWHEYIPFEDLIEHYRQPRSAKIIIVDNLTVYENEIKKKLLKAQIDKLSNKLIIFVAHEERGIPSSPEARHVSKWAKVIFRVKGLTSFVKSRYDGGGGTIFINEDIGEMIWGEEPVKNIAENI
ncbi:MAG: hypothetical protein ACK5KN_07565 [Dysgonomonas sp.]|uniref:hypothetical protein n=1 Tax=Dysgonomonas sp. TaxID=1891233 RepID=UPI003A8B5389